jgi:hypothetical protein
VFSGWDEELERAVAVKLMSSDVSGNSDRLTAFYREARAVGRLAHRNVVTVYDVGEADGRVYLVLELLHGMTLDAWLSQEPVPAIELRLDLLMQLVDGVSAAHREGVVHGDLKPANLFVQHDGILKVLDFGVARLCDTPSPTKEIVGTPDFMSPEQTRGAAVDTRSDIFSIGAIAYFAITGLKPFAAESVHAVLHRVAHASPAAIDADDAPPALIRAVMRCLEKKPARRYQTATDLLGDLRLVREQLARETLEEVNRAKAHFAHLLELLQHQRAVGARLGLAFPEASHCPRVEALVDQFPLVADWFANSPHGSEVPRSLAMRLSEAIVAVISDTRADVASLEEASRRVADAESWRRMEPDRALGAAELAFRAFPTSSVARELVQAVRLELGARRGFETQAEGVLAQARAALADGHLATASELAAKARTLAPWQSRIATGTDDLLGEIQRRTGQRTRAVQEYARRLETLLEARRLAEVESLLAEALGHAPGDPTLAALAQRAKAISAAELERSAERRDMATAIHAARAKVERGDVDEGLADLERFLATHPGAGDVRAELERMGGTARAAAARVRAEAHVLQLVTAAEQALAEQDVDAAIQHAKKAVQADGAHARAREVLDRAQHAQAERRRKAEIAASVSAELSAAATALEKGRLEKAAKLASHAAALDPMAAEPRAFLDRVAAARQSAIEAEAAAQLAAQRQRAAEPALRAARTAVRSGQWTQVRWAAEQALAQDPSSLEARRLWEEARARSNARMPAASSQGTATDDTVTLPRPSALREVIYHVTVTYRELARRFSGRVGIR